MNLKNLKTRSAGVLGGAILVLVFANIISGGAAPAIVLLVGVIGSLALLVLLIAIVADATVQTLKKKKE